MTVRKVKNAKDLSTNELIYFKGHAKATYMSDGSTVEDAINNINQSGGTGNVDLSNYATKTEVNTELNKKQDKLVSGTNIKTINGTPILGSGDITIEGGSSTVDWENVQNKPDIIQDDVNNNLSIGESEKNYFLISIGNSMTVSQNSKTINLDEANTLYLPKTLSFDSSNAYPHGYEMSITPDEISVIWDTNGNDDGTFKITRLGDGSKFLSNDGTYKEINNVSVVGSSAYPIINHGIVGNPVEFTLTPNTFHVWEDVVDGVTLLLGDEIDGVMNEYLFQFTWDDFSIMNTLTLPSTVNWADNIIPDFSDSSFIYQVSIVNNCATMLKFKK